MDKKDVALLTGEGYWFVGPVMVSDGPHGLRKQEKDADFLGGMPSKPAVCYPTASALACSFDKKLLREIGEALGDECLSEGISVLLGPGVNHKRSPRCGRNFEYFSEDPVLTGELAAAMVKGIQSRGVGACVKHFAGNSREWGRMVADSVIDERALFEIYLRQFEIVVKKARPAAMMTAYNKLGGVYCSENEWLMNCVAREKWGFDGVFLSDWGAVSDPVKSAAAGLDVEMPGPDRASTSRLRRALEEGGVHGKKIKERVENVKKFIRRAQAAKKDTSFDLDAHLELARRASAESSVLLKNSGSLPLRADDRVLLVGELAKNPRYQGSGSSRIDPVSLDSIYGELKKTYPELVYAPGYSLDGKKDEKILLDEAVALSKTVDRVVVVAGLPDEYESEGYDRLDLSMPASHDALIEALADSGADVTVVLQCGAPVLTPWADRVGAILLMYLSGCRGGAACADLLTGRANPSGRLAETWPLRTEDDPSYNNFNVSLKRVEHPEGIFTGYRYYDAVGREVRFPFGYGLSYTTFSISDLELIPGDEVVAKCRVTNTGPVAGAHTVGAWVGLEKTRIMRPVRELRDFTKIVLAPEESADVEFRLPREAFAYYDAGSGGWQVEKGDYSVFLGMPGAGPEFCGTVFLDGVEPESEEYDVEARVKGRETEKGEKVVITPDSPVEEIRTRLLGRFLLRIADRKIKKMRPIDAAHARELVYGSPLRALILAHPRFNRDTVDGIVMIFNGHLFRGLFRTLRSLRKK
ncbi:MAG: glycoside hydrolase family 3 C-terminal domain-containing protein [Clostridia bacterium]|nr:glycoside hydrolase family 3 C-terminal domain-containing protein [Clostridia bacterium]